jgi:hypothetical protein
VFVPARVSCKVASCAARSLGERSVGFVGETARRERVRLQEKAKIREETSERKSERNVRLALLAGSTTRQHLKIKLSLLTPTFTPSWQITPSPLHPSFIRSQLKSNVRTSYLVSTTLIQPPQSTNQKQNKQTNAGVVQVRVVQDDDYGCLCIACRSIDL